MVASAVLSAVAFFHATTFADRSTELTNQARFGAAEESQGRSAVNATLIHDQRVLLGCLTSIQARDAAITEYSRRFDDRSIAAVVESEQRRNALEALLISDSSPGCANYQVATELEHTEFFRRQSGEADPRSLLEQSGRYAAAEPLAVVAAVLFAVVLLLLTLADSSSQRRWIRVWLGCAAVVGAVAAILAAAALWTAGEITGQTFALIAAIVAVLGALLWLTARATAGSWILARIGRRSGELTSRAPSPRLQAMRREVRWWAEVLGAVTLVVFAVAALGFSLSSTRQRDAVVAADRFTLEAREALELGEQSALAVLGYVAELAELDASSAAESDATPAGAATTPSKAIAELARRTVLARWEAEQQEWQKLLDQSRDGQAEGSEVPGSETARRSCLRDDQVLVWRQAGETGDAPLPIAIRLEQRTNADALAELVNRSSIGSIQCSTRAAISWQEARGWSDRAGRFTVALLILGLAGFLFALAADPDRTIRPRRWLLGSALAGLAVGLAVTATGWVMEPQRGDQAELDQGALAYARSVTAAHSLDCGTAREAAVEAVARLPGFSRVHVLEGDAWTCSEDAGWLIAPAMSAERLDGFRSSLERAFSPEIGDAAVSGNLGWAHLLAAVLGPEERRAQEVERGLELTEAALRDDAANPFLCFNRALGALAKGDADIARARYREALAGIRGEAVAGSPCSPRTDGPLDALLQDIIRLSALADLELVDDGAGIDEYRAAIVVESAGQAGEAQPDLTGLSVATYPQEIGVVADEGAPLSDAELAIVWYHRPSDDVPWAVVTGPSLATIRPGAHMGLWRLDRRLAAGHYRADIYVDGRIAGRLLSEVDWWGSHGLDPDDFRWVQLPDLGVSAVIPAEWELVSEERGVEVVYGSDTGSVSFRRGDGDAQAGLGDRVRSWSGKEWDETEDDGSAFYLGLDTTVVHNPEPGTWVGGGHRRYVTPPTGEFPLTSQADDPSCPGTTIMTSVEADDPEVARTVWDSQVLITTPPTVPADQVGLTSPFVSPFFSIEFPDDWVATACPRKFVGGAPDRSQNVIVSTEEFDGTAVEYLDQSTASYGEDFENFAEERRESVVLPNGVPGERLTYTWTSDGQDVRQVQTFAVTDGLGYLMTITHRRDEPLQPATAALLLESLRPGRSASLVPAACEGCSAEEREERQRAVDEIAGRLATIDDAYCNDTTDSFEEDALASIGCSFPGGFHADFALWPSKEAVQQFAGPFNDQPEATVNDWFLDGADKPKTGMTVEWTEEGDARFFWTYDDLRLTGNALLVGGDAERLNNWWQTTGSLARE